MVWFSPLLGQRYFFAKGFREADRIVEIDEFQLRIIVDEFELESRWCLKVFFSPCHSQRAFHLTVLAAIEGAEESG